jgi:two-component system cell cycle response regulator DivK
MPEPTQSVLYVEDNEDNRILVKRILEAEGILVFEAESAAEGLIIARKRHPSLILVDINLPEVDGLALTGHIRDDPELAHTPIVAITADVIRGNRERTLSAGCNGFIQKPIDVDTLPMTIKKHLATEIQ